MDDQTDTICRVVVTQNGMALQFVRKRNAEWCVVAVRQNGMALQFVPTQTFQMCIFALQNHPSALMWVHPSLSLWGVCRATCKQNGRFMTPDMKQECSFVMFINDEFDPWSVNIHVCKKYLFHRVKFTDCKLFDGKPSFLRDLS